MFRFWILGFAGFILMAISAQAQMRDMPSQAEFDPILENADTKVKEFLTTLTKYRKDASEIDNERLEKDLHDFRQLREMIASAHSGAGNHGITVARVFSVVTSLDDAAMDAALWSSLSMARICAGKGSESLVSFAMAVQSDGGMLREVSNQMFYPTFRLTVAADEIILALSNPATEIKPKPNPSQK